MSATKRMWRDAEGNTYAVERAARTGRFIVVRYNPGGHRKAARRFDVAGNEGYVQKALDTAALKEGWRPC